MIDDLRYELAMQKALQIPCFTEDRYMARLGFLRVGKIPAGWVAVGFDKLWDYDNHTTIVPFIVFRHGGSPEAYTEFLVEEES